MQHPRSIHRLNLPPAFRRAFALCLVALAAGAVAPAPAGAADPPVRTLQDIAGVPSASAVIAELNAIKPSVCSGVRGSAGAVRLGRAVNTAERVLKRRAGSKAYTRLRRAARKSAQAETIGVHGLVGGAPGSTLAAALAAHDREPRNPRHLINASVVLTGLGQPREALALLDAAKRLRFPAYEPMGIDLRALMLNNRGYALIALRRYAAAVVALKAAVAREPLLAEAKANLAVAYLCSGQTARAVTPYLAGKRRNPFTAAGAARAAAAARDIPTSGGGTSLPPAASVLDMSQGVPMQLPTLRLPQTPEDGVASADALSAAFDRVSAREQAAYDVNTSARSEMYAPGTSDPRRLARIGQIEGFIGEWQTQRPDLKALMDKLQANHARMLEIMSGFGARFKAILDSCLDQPPPTTITECARQQCVPVLSSAHSEWLAVNKDSYAVARTYAADLYRYVTGLAANIKHPAAGRAAVAVMTAHIWGWYGAFVVHPASVWTSTEASDKEYCTGTGGASGAEDDQGDVPAGTFCPPQLKAVKFSISIPIPDTPANLGLSADCESIAAELSGRTPITPFGNVDYNFVQNRTTIFIGVKGGASDLLVKAGLKNGIYVTIDGKGRVSDYGVRAQVTTGTNSGGPIDFGGKSRVQYSLAGIW